MRKILAAALLAAIPFTFTGSTAYAEGCVEDFLGTGNDSEPNDVVVMNPDGSITIYPPGVPKVVLAWVVRDVNEFVDCVV